MTGIEAVPAEARGLLVAASAALACGGAARLLGWRRLAAAAAGIGLAAGFAAILGLVNASPRQVFERLSSLAVLGAALGLLAAMAGRPAWRLALAVLGVGVGAWWLAGGPLHPPDMLRVAPAWAGLAAAMALAVWRAATLPAMALSWAALAAGVAAAAALGPFVGLALAGCGALAGILVAGGRPAMAARLPLGLALAGVAAVPVMARAAPADIAAACAPAMALLAGPWVGRRLPGRLGPWLVGPWLGPLLAAAPAVVAAWWLA